MTTAATPTPPTPPVTPAAAPAEEKPAKRRPQLVPLASVTPSTEAKLGAVNKDCVCPHCAHNFLVPFDQAPDPGRPIVCPDCKSEFPLRRYLEPAANRTQFTGDPVTCPRCTTVYKPQFKTGSGVQWRQCPTCFMAPPGQPTFSTLEQQGAPAV